MDSRIKIPECIRLNLNIVFLKQTMIDGERNYCKFLIFLLIVGPYQTVIDELNVCTIILENPPTYDDYRQSVECKH